MSKATHTTVPLFFSRTEIESYLPSGWNLPIDSPEGEWNAKTGVWTSTVVDGVDFEWPVEVSAELVREKGRSEALATAIDRSFRNRLGKPTRGLGIGARF